MDIFRVKKFNKIVQIVPQKKKGKRKNIKRSRSEEESRREAERLYRRHSVQEGSRIFHVVDLRARLNNRAMLVGGRAAGVLFGTLFQVHD